MNPQLVDELILFEENKLSFRRTVKLFAKLIEIGSAKQLQGFYQKFANKLIEARLIDDKGNINEEVLATYSHSDY